MKRVLQINDINSKRKQICLDNGVSFPLYNNELRLYDIRENEYLSEKSERELFEELLPKRAKLRAMNLLKLKPYTVKGLRDKLSDGGYPDEITQCAIDYVSSYRYLDDYQYSCDYFNTYKDRKNSVRMKSELMAKGVDKDVIENAYYDVFGEDDEDYEAEQILSILKKKHYDKDNASYEEKMKIFASVCRRGYSPEKVKKIMFK